MKKTIIEIKLTDLQQGEVHEFEYLTDDVLELLDLYDDFIEIINKKKLEDA